ncbi:hypothetical protein HNR62_000427 [Oceanisphaera litoralis]|uniref:hypothetical protein n=1 Tax=Oceanisphaera litoralis TaxID=225144 RepID=UPI00195974CE|nr:hypothetical protein [Oceanisphaera litoralis]MBM7454598.1 hypothetical protein [Oceanisphaera litoralis]
MAVGIKVEGCKDIKIIDCGFSGLETGIDVSDSDDIHVDGADFQNVGTGLKARRVKGLKASSCTETTSSDFRLTPAAKIVRWYTEYLNMRG